MSSPNLEEYLSEDEETLAQSNHENGEVEERFDVEGEEFYPVEYSISSYGADYPVDGLVKRINGGSIYIPKFQRSYVWNIFRASRLIESLLLGLPVPAIFFSKESDSNKLLVIDGQQRLKTLQFYYKGVFEPGEKAFKLKGVQNRFLDKTYQTLDEDDRIRLDDSIIHAIIVKQDNPAEAQNGPSSIYHIFERLNTGGVLLQPQEIRSCIFHGPFIELLDTLNQNENWRNLFGKISTRMRDRELILRFFALYYDADSYTKPMKEFLNRFAWKHRNIDQVTALNYTKLFQNTTSSIYQAIGSKAFKPKKAVNAALCDSLLVGVANRLKSGPIADLGNLKNRHNELLGNEHYIAAISSATTDEGSISERIRITKEQFGDAP